MIGNFLTPHFYFCGVSSQKNAKTDTSKPKTDTSCGNADKHKGLEQLTPQIRGFLTPEARCGTNTAKYSKTNTTECQSMKVTAFPRSTRAKNEGEKLAFVYIRVYAFNEINIRMATPIRVNPKYWDSRLPGYMADTPEGVIPKAQRMLLNRMIRELLTMITENYQKGCDARWLSSVIDECTAKTGIVRRPKLSPQNANGTETRAKEETSPERKEMGKERLSPPTPQPMRERHFKKEPECEDVVKQDVPAGDTQEKRDNDVDADGRKTLLAYFRQYLDEADFGSWHREAQTCVMHRLERYEKWLGFVSGMPDYRLMLEEMDKEAVEDFAVYMEREHEYRDETPELYNEMNLHSAYDIRPVSKNSVTTQIKRLCMFLNWAVKSEYLEDTSFRNITCDQQLYGTPYYLTIEERDKVAALDLHNTPRLELHRDKFIFQCHVGCRQNDLDLFTWKHINGDFLEYIPHKNLRAGRTQLVRVPLSGKAKEILMKIDPDAEFLFRQYCDELYRVDIKKILKKAGINRKVMVYNPLKQKTESRVLYEVASSHIARRTFIGNLYKQVKDPALIAALTGHTETSVSFTRYRAIDDDIKREILKIIE